MMLHTFLSNIPRRYALACSAAGALAPFIYLTSRGMAAGGGGDVSALLSDPAHLLLMSFPLVTGAGGYLAGLYRSRMEELLAELSAGRQTLIHEARHDALTGLLNRKAFEEELAHRQEAWRFETQALLLADLDRFKFVNDTLGHDAGDELLLAFADRVERATEGSGCLFRIGGDEFAILVRPGLGHDAVDEICRRIGAALAVPFDLAKGRVAVGASIGVAFLEAEDPNIAEPMMRADLALYKAKEIAGSSHVYFDHKLGDEAVARMEIERDLARALADGEFFLEYQPIVGVESRMVRSFEALLRWNHPTRGVIQPQGFIPAAERNGAILPIGRWVMREAAREAAGWPSPTGVAVNIAGDQFKDPNFVPYVQECLEETGLAPGRLTIEVTESLFTIAVEDLREQLSLLRGLGVRIALDDFGTGFSSISNLKQFPLDQLKIDRSFSKAMMADKRDAELVDLMTRLGETFKVAITVEGIETEGQMDYVRSIGVSEVQGFLISRPVPAGAVAAFLTASEETGRIWALP